VLPPGPPASTLAPGRLQGPGQGRGPGRAEVVRPPSGDFAREPPWPSSGFDPSTTEDHWGDVDWGAMGMPPLHCMEPSFPCGGVRQGAFQVLPCQQTLVPPLLIAPGACPHPAAAPGSPPMTLSTSPCPGPSLCRAPLHSWVDPSVRRPGPLGRLGPVHHRLFEPGDPLLAAALLPAGAVGEAFPCASRARRGCSSPRPSDSAGPPPSAVLGAPSAPAAPRPTWPPTREAVADLTMTPSSSVAPGPPRASISHSSRPPRPPGPAPVHAPGGHALDSRLLRPCAACLLRLGGRRLLGLTLVPLCPRPWVPSLPRPWRPSGSSPSSPSPPPGCSHAPAPGPQAPGHWPWLPLRPGASPPHPLTPGAGPLVAPPRPCPLPRTPLRSSAAWTPWLSPGLRWRPHCRRPGRSARAAWACPPRRTSCPDPDLLRGTVGAGGAPHLHPPAHAHAHASEPEPAPPLCFSTPSPPAQTLSLRPPPRPPFLLRYYPLPWPCGPASRAGARCAPWRRKPLRPLPSPWLHPQGRTGTLPTAQPLCQGAPCGPQLTLDSGPADLDPGPADLGLAAELCRRPQPSLGSRPLLPPRARDPSP